MTQSTSSHGVEHRGALIATVFLLQFLVALDISLVNIALPAIRADLGFTAAGLQWVVTAYLVTFAGFMLLGGRIGDLWGRRRTVLVGLVVFAVASIAGGCAVDAGVLVAARAVQGVAGALLAPASLALVTAIDDPAVRKRAMGLWGGAGAAGGALGVVLSGVLTEWWSWRAVLLVNVPIIAVAVVTALCGVPRAERSRTGRLDVPGAVTVTAGVAALVFAVSSGGDRGWGSWQAIAGFVGAAVLLAAFVVIERSVDHPLMPPSLVSRRSVLGANAFGFMVAAGQLAAFYFCSLYIQTVWGVDSAMTGVLFLPFCIFVVVGIVMAQRLSAQMGARIAMVILGLLAAIGLGLFAMMPAHFDFWLGIVAPSALTAVGIGGAMVLVGAVATDGVAGADIGIASGVVNSSRQLGGTIGLAVLVTIASGYEVPRDGLLMGFAIGAVFLVVGSAAAWLILPRRVRDALPTTPREIG
ncbi:MFS transporter [Gordonia aichiensis]